MRFQQFRANVNRIDIGEEKFIGQCSEALGYFGPVKCAV